MFRAMGHRHSAEPDFGVSVSDATTTTGLGGVTGGAAASICDTAAHGEKDRRAQARHAPTARNAARAELGATPGTGQTAGDLYRTRQACHDARQELALIAAMAEQLERDAGLRADQRRTAQTISRQARSVAGLLRGTLSTMSPEATDLTGVLADLVDQLRLVCDADIGCAVEPDITLECDPVRLRRTFLNVLDNAVRAAGPAGRVEVRGRRVGDQVTVEVEDSGPGFGRATPGVAAIGLSIVRDWVAESGGRLALLDGDLGGALVRITVPVGPRPVASLPIQRAR